MNGGYTFKSSQTCLRRFLLGSKINIPFKPLVLITKQAKPRDDPTPRTQIWRGNIGGWVGGWGGGSHTLPSGLRVPGPQGGRRVAPVTQPSTRSQRHIAPLSGAQLSFHLHNRVFWREAKCPSQVICDKNWQLN